MVSLCQSRLPEIGVVTELVSEHGLGPLLNSSKRVLFYHHLPNFKRREELIVTLRYVPYLKENFAISDSQLFCRKMVDDSRNVEKVNSITIPLEKITLI